MPNNRLGILLSGRGSNFQAIARNIECKNLDAQIAVVISNRADAGGLSMARELGIPSVCVPSYQSVPREEYDLELVRILQSHQVDLVCLAGFMRLLSPGFVRAFPQRILNIHPSLLPAFPGMDGQGQALRHGVKVSGCTVHFVDEHLDSGPIVLQAAVEVLDGDTEAELAARILSQEHVLYSQAIGLVLSGQFGIDGRRVIARCVNLKT